MTDDASFIFLLHLIMDFRIQEFIAIGRFKSAQVVDKHKCLTLSACHRDQADGLPCTLHVKQTLAVNNNSRAELKMNRYFNVGHPAVCSVTEFEAVQERYVPLTGGKKLLA